MRVQSVMSSCDFQVREKKEAYQNFWVTSPLIPDTLITKDYVSQIHVYSALSNESWWKKGYLQKIYVDEGQLSKKAKWFFNDYA